LYGSLEDEVRCASVRRLVEHEDYILLKLQDAGLPSPRSLGFCEITPEREYAIVTEFLDNAKEMGDAEVDDDIIDQSLIIVRKLWDAGMFGCEVPCEPVLTVHDMRSAKTSDRWRRTLTRRTGTSTALTTSPNARTQPANPKPPRTRSIRP